jgi:hypothetical protein
MDDKAVLIFYCDPTMFPIGRFVEATPREIELLRLVDNVPQWETRENLPAKQAHIIILHYLDRADLYETEREFNGEMKGFRESGWDQEALDMLTWKNKGKWDRAENKTVNNECNGASHFYHIHIDTSSYI